MNPAPAADVTGRVLVDNCTNITSISVSSENQDAQGFTSGATLYELTGVEITLGSLSNDAAISVWIRSYAVGWRVYLGKAR